MGPIPSQRQAGFTLVEVLVALFIMAVLAGMAWQGVDGLVRTRDGAQAAAEDALRTAAVLAQWEQDLNRIHNSSIAPALSFDGAGLRMTRRTPEGVQIVLWMLQSETWYRWTSPPVTNIQQLQEAWLRSQQWAAIAPEALRVMSPVSGIQVYFYRGNAWTNAQSSGDIDVPPPPGSEEPEDEEEKGGEGGKGGSSSGSGSGTGRRQVRGSMEQLPTGVRLVLTLSSGALTRDVLVMPAGP